VDLFHLGQSLGGKLRRNAHKRGPEPAVYERDLRIDEATHKNLFRLSHCLSDREDLVTLGVRPPTASDGPAGNCLCERRGGASSRFQYHSVPADERESPA